LTLKEHKNGKFGCNFVKCESKPKGRVKSKFFSHLLSLISTNFCKIWDLGFMISFSDHEEMLLFWVDGRLHPEASRDGLVGLEGGHNPWAQCIGFGDFAHDSVTATMGDAELKGELKKMNKNLKRMIELKKQSYLISLRFYVGILALGFFYLMVISR
jgi:hypothetical protein